MAERASGARPVPRSSTPFSRTPKLTRSVFSVALSVATLSVIALSLVVSVTASPAAAQDSLAEIDEQIEEAWRELEPVIEEHNATRIKLKEKKKAADELAEKIKPLEAEVDAAREQVTEIAVYNFKGGSVSAVRALLTTGSPLTLGEQLAMLDRFARSQQETIRDAVETKAEYEAEKVELDGLVEELTQIEDDLAERADEIDAEIDRLKEMQDELVAEQEAAPTTDTGGSGSSSGNAGACPSYDPGGGAGAAVNFACAQVGKPYGWGQSGPDAYDCSGLTSTAWEQGGVRLPHNAAQQRDTVPYIERSDLLPGDLVFFYSDLSHVAMYAGDGYVVQASNPSDPVNVAPIDQMSIHSYGRPG